MADPQGQWLVKMPKSRWPSEYVTSTTTTTMTTSTVTTTTITTTTVTSTTVTTTETQTSTATNTSTSTTTMNTTTTTNSSSAAEMQISSTTTVTTSTITMTMTTSAEERDFHEMGSLDLKSSVFFPTFLSNLQRSSHNSCLLLGVDPNQGAPDEEAKIPEVPKEPAQWLAGFPRRYRTLQTGDSISVSECNNTIT